MLLNGSIRDSRRNSIVLIFVILMFLSGTSSVWASSSRVGNTSPSAVETTATLSTLSLTEWAVPTPSGGPWGITVDSSGKIWFTENATSKLARFDPSNDNFTEWSIPSGGNPRYLFSNGTGIYFTEYTSNKIGFLNPASNIFYEWQLPAGSNPVGLYVEQNNTVWFTESGRDAIGRLLPNSNQLTEWTLPGATPNPGTPLLEPWAVYAQPSLSGQFHNVTDRLIWFTEAANNAIGMLQVTTNLLVLWDLSSLNIIPGLKYGPTDITVDSTGNVLFTASTGDRISLLVNGGGVYHEYSLPPHPSTVKPTSLKIDTTRNLVWFTEYNSAIIGNANTNTVATNQAIPSQSQCTLPPATGSNMCASPAGVVTTTSSLTVSAALPTATIVTPPLPSTVSIYQTTQAVTEYRLPTLTARPNSVTLDTAGNVWFTESNTTINSIARLSIPYVFQLSVSPTAHTINPGQSTDYGVSVNLLNGTALPVQLSLTNAVPSLGVSFSTQSGTPPFTSTLTISTTNSTIDGVYTMNVVATSGRQTQSATITLTVQSLPPPSFDFGMQIIGTDTATIPQAGPASFQVEITLTSGTSENVSLTATGLPSGTTPFFTDSSGFPPYTATLNIQTNIETPPGSYPITITGTSSGGVTHDLSPSPVLQITEVTRDFNLTASANDVILVQASRTDLTLTITSIGPFSGNVTLNGEFSPSAPGLTATFSPSLVTTQQNGGITQVTLEIVATRNTPGQTYHLTVTGSSPVPSRTHQITIAVRVSPCLIATAAFGSELSPEVQFLRTFRDQQVMRTFAGSDFMTIFNAWYYSFSPAVAQFEYSHTLVKSIIRSTLYPLIGILHLSSMSYSILAAQPELAVLTAGVLASCLIGLVYVAFPISCLLCLTKKRLHIRFRSIMKWTAVALTPALLAFIVAEWITATWLMMFATGAIVLVTVVSTGVLGLRLLLQCVERIF